jgi:mRNA interferase MazF
LEQIHKIDIRQKDIVLLPYPFSDLEGKKVRPALVVSNDSFNKTFRDCVLIPLTTVIKDVPFSVLISQDDLAFGEIPKLSRARADKLFTVEQNLIFLKIGTIKDSVFSKIKTEIQKLF